MKHRKVGKQFGRVRKQRQAMFRSLLGSLVEHECIETTEAKAKELKRYADRVITRAKRADSGKNEKLTITRKLEGMLPLVAIQKISAELLPRLSKRTSGYTRVTKLPQRRSDSAKMAVIEFVDREEKKAAPKKAAKTGDKKTEAKDAPAAVPHAKEKIDQNLSKAAPAAPDKSFHRPNT